MEHLLQKSKCSIFHNIFEYVIFQRHQRHQRHYYGERVNGVNRQQKADTRQLTCAILKFKTIISNYWETCQITTHSNYVGSCHKKMILLHANNKAYKICSASFIIPFTDNLLLTTTNLALQGKSLHGKEAMWTLAPSPTGSAP